MFRTHIFSQFMRQRTLFDSWCFMHQIISGCPTSNYCSSLNASIFFLLFFFCIARCSQFSSFDFDISSLSFIAFAFSTLQKRNFIHICLIIFEIHEKTNNRLQFNKLNLLARTAMKYSICRIWLYLKLKY